ncbi:hypothetical protein HMPREF1218_2100 [Hoylesella pleuritidis F0068]|uniref:Uncharacterized protein n=1 Tax=Hoylesella pleuritidis F0068 TaxID=1081904 RepID=U2KWL6_9BACT|nr:hypothetical protein HMPREF1218_2100 [Hoylesella pleuritidis F0068]
MCMDITIPVGRIESKCRRRPHYERIVMHLRTKHLVFIPSYSSLTLTDFRAVIIIIRTDDHKRIFHNVPKNQYKERHRQQETIQIESYQRFFRYRKVHNNNVSNKTHKLENSQT